ncbi:MAG: amino acid racemase [Propionibacteriaceae bacterium]|jgi:aspartate racemase|nr:amino acid racemase [Propionibacteriaceae bacterium]
MTLHTLGLLGGMTYHSTVDYYLGINDAIAARRGGHNSAPLLVDSLNFAAVREYQTADDWEGAGRLLADHALALQAAGAEAIVICTNLMHKVAPAVAARLDVPLLHITDAIAFEAEARGLRSLGSLGTKWVMQEGFYTDALIRSGIQPVFAGDDDIATTDRIVFEELTKGIIADASRDELVGVVDRLAKAGADGVILGCTEIPLLMHQHDTVVPLVDSTQAHVALAVKFVMGEI